MASRNRPPSPKRNLSFAARAALVGLAALFSGAALLATIIGGMDLRVSLAVTTAIGLGIFAVIVGRASREGRRLLLRLAFAGSVGGLIATLAYDSSRYLLSQFDPSPYNPFEAITAFGTLLAGGTAGAEWTMAVGASFHALNGVMFGVSYCLFFGRWGAVSLRRALVTGIGWGLFLELFQVTLYPGWLNISAYAEFATISAAGHLVYGAVLGLACRSLLRRLILRRA